MKFQPYALRLLGLMCFTLAAGCKPDPSKSAAEYEEGGVVYGDQGWTREQRAVIYNEEQGCLIFPYTWILHLEQYDKPKPFLDDAYIEGLRFIPRGFDPANPDRLDHLPVGFAKFDSKKAEHAKHLSPEIKKHDWFGFTCAACHVSEIDYGGKSYRIDGAGTLADCETLLTNLTASIQSTLNDDAKFEKFAKGVLGAGLTDDSKKELKAELEKQRIVREDYDHRNASKLKYGYARLDAFGRIFNKALWEAHPVDNFNPPDAPVSLPFLWGTDQSDFVQWVGNASNANIGRIGRNTGEILGVFAWVNVKKPDHELHGYPSSAASQNQIDLEQSVRDLYAPAWPDSFPPIDTAKAARGKELYKMNCAACHNLVNRTDKNRKVVAWMERLESIGTDPKTAMNTGYRGKTGLLEGRKKFIKAGPVFGPETNALSMVTHVVAGMLLARKAELTEDELISFGEGRGGGGPKKQGNLNPDPSKEYHAYKGRSLTGAWATAPFLHNGSVPSLWQLMTSEKERVKTFYVGSREFDPKEVGLEYRTKTPHSFEFNTQLEGNSNQGHTYGTELNDDEKWEIIEFMKTDMNP